MPRTLLIDRADVPSIAALALEVDHADIILWHRPGRTEADARRSVRVKQHADLFGVAQLVEAPVRSGIDTDVDRSELLIHASDLVETVTIALQHGADRIIWTAHAGPHPEPVGHLATIAHEVAGWVEWVNHRGIAIDLPIVELTDRQLLELIDDAGIPIALAWPCERGGEEPCTICQSCRRWLIACDDLGLGWPWAKAPVAT
jgi:hypothetical protein